MKKTIFFLALIAASVFSCAPPATVYTHYEPTLATTYQSYAWADPVASIHSDQPAYLDGQTITIIQKAINDELNAKGYQLALDSPDLLISFKMVIEQRQKVRTAPYSFPDERGHYHVDVYDYQTGVLNIYMTDAHTDQVVWRGVAKALLFESPDEKFSAMVSKAVAKLYADFAAQEKNSLREI